MLLAVSEASSVFKTCLFSGDGFSLQGYEGPFRHERSVSSIVKPHSPQGASPSSGACSQSAALESIQAAKWENADALSVSVFIYAAEKHCGVPEKGQQWPLFSFCLAFVLSVPSFCLLFCLCLMLRGLFSWWPLAEAPGACQWSACYPAGFPVI